ncbi:hypothetical protein [Streptomyces sp.]
MLETSGTAVVVKVLTRLTRWTDLVEAMVSVAAGAREQLVVTGSRPREKAHLAAIATTVDRSRAAMASRHRTPAVPAARNQVRALTGGVGRRAAARAAGTAAGSVGAGAGTVGAAAAAARAAGVRPAAGVPAAGAFANLHG